MGNGGAAKKIHVFNSFFYPKLSQSGFSGVRRWTRKVSHLLRPSIPSLFFFIYAEVEERGRSLAGHTLLYAEV